MESIFILRESYSENYYIDKAIAVNEKFNKLQLGNPRELIFVGNFPADKCDPVLKEIYNKFSYRNVPDSKWFELTKRELQMCIDNIYELILTIGSNIRFNCKLCGQPFDNEHKHFKHVYYHSLQYIHHMINNKTITIVQMPTSMHDYLVNTYIRDTMNEIKKNNKNLIEKMIETEKINSGNTSYYHPNIFFPI